MSCQSLNWLLSYAQQIGAVPRNRLDLIPYYSRLIATLNKYMPDVGSGMIAVVSVDRP